MSCSRCGQNRTPRPVPPPSAISRPGGVYHQPVPRPTPVLSGNRSARDLITGLKYVPGK